MFDPVMIGLSLLHAAALIGLLVVMCKKTRVPWKDVPFVVLLLLWTSLVFTGHGAGLGSNLGHLAIYAPLSFVALGLVLAFIVPFWRMVPAEPLLRAPHIAFAAIENPRTRKFLFWFLGGTLALFAAISVVLAMGVYPDNADSMIYRLPRAIWYASNGSFLHPFDSEDKRLIFYPLNGVALYIPLVLYGLPGTFHSIPSLLSWGMIVYTVFRFARELGAERLIALFAAWLVGLTPSILAQATSTNDEIIAAAALIASLYMGWRWLVTGRHAYFLMAGIAVALSAGTKLHIIFLMPMIAICLGVALWKIKKDPALLPAWAKAIGWKTGVTTLALVLVIFTPFLFYNYASVGRFYFLDDFKNDVFNLSASLRAGAQNLLIYLSQMILSPIADLNFWPVANDRQHFNNILNGLFTPLIKPWIDENPDFYHMGYRFVGITLPVSVRFVEFSLWSAFVWLLWPWQAALTLKQKTFPLRSVFFVLAITPPLWLLLWCFTTLYMEGTATYFIFYLVVASPAAVMVFAPIRRAFLNELRWVVVAFVVVTNLIISHNLVMYSGFRALPDLFYARALPYDWLITEPGIIKEIRLANRIRIVFTHEKMPYFGYMHWNPRATYYTPYPLKDSKALKDIPGILQVLPISSLNMYGYMPIKVPGKLTPGVTYLGAVRAIGREAIFAAGNNVEKRHPTESNYLIPHTDIIPLKNGAWGIAYGQEIAGFSTEDQLTFEHEVRKNGVVLFHREAKRDPSFSIRVDANPHQENLALTTIVRSAWNGKELTRVTYPLGGPGGWLPEGGDY